MEVEVYVQQTVRVDVPLRELLDQIPGLDEPERVDQAQAVVSRCVTALGRIGDELIGAMSPRAREIVATALRQQLARYEPAGRGGGGG